MSRVFRFFRQVKSNVLRPNITSERICDNSAVEMEVFANSLSYASCGFASPRWRCKEINHDGAN
jgi:hypothetical protein